MWVIGGLGGEKKMEGRIYECLEYIGGSISIEEDAWESVKKLLLPDIDILVKLERTPILKEELGLELAVVTRRNLIYLEIKQAIGISNAGEIPSEFIIKAQELSDIEDKYNAVIVKEIVSKVSKSDLPKNFTVDAKELIKKQRELLDLAKRTGILKILETKKQKQ